MMTVEPIETRRQSLTPKQFSVMLMLQGGVCFKCKGPGPFIEEHSTPVALGNQEKPDCLLCKPCAKAKTYGEPGRIGGDIRDIAHTKRIREKRTQYDKREAAGGSRIKSRGFQKTKTRRFDGSVTERKDG